MEGVEPSQEAKYWADQIGAYEVHFEEGNSSNKVLKQMVPALPIGWSDHGSNGPMTLLGMREWADLEMSVKFKLPSAEASACLGSRVDQMWRNGIVLCVHAGGTFNLTVGGPVLPRGPDATITDTLQHTYVSGTAASAVGAGGWHTLALTTVGDSASGVLDVVSLFSAQPIRNLDTGFAALGMNDWFAVEFDDFVIKPAGPAWEPPVSPCTAAKVGDVVSARNCSTNGLPVADQEWELKSNWQLKHITSGLCAEADPQGTPWDNHLPKHM